MCIAGLLVKESVSFICGKRLEVDSLYQRWRGRKGKTNGICGMMLVGMGDNGMLSCRVHFSFEDFGEVTPNFWGTK